MAEDLIDVYLIDVIADFDREILGLELIIERDKLYDIEGMSQSYTLHPGDPRAGELPSVGAYSPGSPGNAVSTEGSLGGENSASGGVGALGSADVIEDSSNPLATIRELHEDLVDSGRNGLGMIFVKSAGNFRQEGWNSGLDGTAGLGTDIAVGAIAIDGYVTDFSSPGANLLITTFTGMLDPVTGEMVGGIVSLDAAPGSNEAVVRFDFAGTSASAPMVTGIASLMLDANPNLGWRDVQDILAYSARAVGTLAYKDEGYWGAAREKYEWTINGADDLNGGGLHFSNDYGFGLVDAHAAVRLAETWTRLQTSANYVQVVKTALDRAVPLPGDELPDASEAGQTFTVTVSERADLTVDRISLSIEFFGAHTSAGDIVIEVISPSGTKSVLLQNEGGARDFDFTVLGSNAFRGESAAGEWTIRVADTLAGDFGTLKSLDLAVLGDLPSPDGSVWTDEFDDAFALDAADQAGLAVTANQDRDDDNADGGHGASFSTLFDGAGLDTVNAAAMTTDIYMDLRAGHVTRTRVDDEWNSMFAISRDTQIENGFTGDGDDHLTGNALDNWLRVGRGSDKLWGRDGADRLDGGPGDDHVQGGDGDDFIEGGRGVDRVWGGRGDDTFYFASAADGGDHIAGFGHGDRIALDRDGFGLDAGFTFQDGFDYRRTGPRPDERDRLAAVRQGGRVALLGRGRDRRPRGGPAHAYCRFPAAGGK